jgi:DNA-binding NtrC family response regulator
MFSTARRPIGERHTMCAPSRVLVSAGDLGARPDIANVIAACGAMPDPISASQHVADRRPCSLCDTAVVATGQALSDGSATLNLVRTLHARGFTVIGYEDGVNAWPLASRCKLMLSGCMFLLDSKDDRFLDDLRQLLEQTARAGARKWAQERDVKQAMAAHGVVGESCAMLDVFRCVRRISTVSDLATLITGETGTGKELLARAIHALDAKRRTGPFIAVNCGALTPSLAESELFGHRRGAFTGADRNRQGLFRAAHGGVLFLDEIAELGSHMEAKLLRVLQDNRVTAVGDDHDAAVSVRVIAATNANLRERVENGQFRADLFHRLNVLSIHIPPVRERRADVPALVEHFAWKYRSLNETASSSICPEFVEALARLALPGNARQIENLVRGALVHNDGTRPLGLADLPPEVWQQLAEEPALSDAAPAESAGTAPPSAAGTASIDLLEANGWSLSRTLDACERSFLQAALNASEGNQAKTARLLGITPRTVYNKLRRHRLF